MTDGSSRYKKAKIKSDLTSKLRKIVKGKRVGVFIDAANLYYSANMVGIHVDFEQLSTWFGKHSDSVLLNFYTAFDEEDAKQLQFLDNLAGHSYNVVKKPVKVFNDLRKGNMDIELAVDALLQSGDYDIFILMSGDGDFHYLLKTLEANDKKSIVLGVGGFTSFELHTDADEYFFMNRIAGVWRGNRRKKENREYYVFIDQIEENDYNMEYTPQSASQFVAPRKVDKIGQDTQTPLERLVKMKPAKAIIDKTDDDSDKKLVKKEVITKASQPDKKTTPLQSKNKKDDTNKKSLSDNNRRPVRASVKKPSVKTSKPKPIFRTPVSTKPKQVSIPTKSAKKPVKHRVRASVRKAPPKPKK